MVFLSAGSANGILPNLIGVRNKVNLGILFTVEQAGLFVVKIGNDFIVLVVVEEGFIGANNFGVGVEPRSHLRTKIDDRFDSVCRQETVAEDFVGFLADAIHAASPLDEPNDRPRQVKVDDDESVLKVLSFAQDIGGNKNSQFLVGRNRLLVALRAKPVGKVGDVFRVAGRRRNPLDARGRQLVAQIMDRSR